MRASQRSKYYVRPKNNISKVFRDEKFLLSKVSSYCQAEHFIKSATYFVLSFWYPFSVSSMQCRASCKCHLFAYAEASMVVYKCIVQSKFRAESVEQLILRSKFRAKGVEKLL